VRAALFTLQVATDESVRAWRAQSGGRSLHTPVPLDRHHFSARALTRWWSRRLFRRATGCGCRWI